MYKIYPIKVAECKNEGPRIYYLGDCDEVLDLYNMMFLIKGEERVILVDTGFDEDFGKQFMPEMKQKPQEAPLKQLARLGVKPEEVTDVILTHLHFDHASPTLDNFTNAQIYVQRQELSTVCAPIHPWFAQFTSRETVKKLISDYSERVTLIEREAMILPGIMVFWTGGHTPGHQSVAVETDEGTAVLTGDVVFTYRNIEEDIPGGFNSSLVESFLAMNYIRSLGDIIIPGHERLIFDRYGEEIG